MKLGIWRWLTRGGGGGRNEVSPNDAIAAAISANLRGLGLYVRSKKYGDGFCEIAASTSSKMITLPHDPEASGVALLLAQKYDPPTLVFEEINSLRPGLGRAMIGAVAMGLNAHPGVFGRIRVNDLSRRLHDGRRWWEHIADAYPEFEWIITHDADFQTHIPEPLRRPAESEDFLKKSAKLHELALEFGHDPGKAVLSPETRIFDCLGQSFTAEGEAFPDGSIKIYYDPKMSDARMACCLAHEIQHLRYFAVREAYLGEPEDGPLHGRFSKFTPGLLAAQRGVSDYSNEHWDSWRAAAPPKLFSMEMEEGGSEPINETVADVAKALYNWGPEVRINPVWKELQQAVNDEYRKLTSGGV
ncbi:hypothetical protein [Methylocystis heyeri]|uniref:hypothetical protein n=1 Tax=Methylocystis heyeri TaxID=391905 RepID=UPI001134AFF4|nr:hypothetical protein [Methylocystis heyeri]